MDAPTRREWLQFVAGALASASLPACRTDSNSIPDVCIVGSGPAGATLATTLAGRGISTLLLEGGPNPVPAAADAVYAAPDLSATSDRLAYPVELTRFLGDGGTSNLWGGECPRCQPVDFDAANPYMPADNPWALSYADLEPFYKRAEDELLIAGDPPNAFSPPRSTGFSRALPPSADADCFHELLDKAGVAFERTPTSETPRIVESHFPRLATLPAAVLERNSRVVELITDGGSRVTHLRVVDQEGRTRTVRAAAFVLACGGVETARLLLRSKTDAFPDGLGNRHDQLGRYFLEHLAVSLGSWRLPAKPACQEVVSGICWQFSSEFKQLGLGNAVFELVLVPDESVVRVTAVLEMKPSEVNRVSLSRTVVDGHGEAVADAGLRISEAEIATWRHARDVVQRIGAALKAKRLEGPVSVAQWTHHQMGTCRMGPNPASSVVDTNLLVHGLDNVYVSSSASFVTCGAGAPTLLLTALGLRLADHLTQEFGTAGRRAAAGLSAIWL